MKIPLSISTSCLIAITASAAVPVRWTVETSRVQPAQFEAYHGETLRFEAALQSYGRPFAPTNNLVAIYWQTNGMDSAYWIGPAVISNHVLLAEWVPAMDVGATVYQGFIGAPGEIYRASFQLRLRPSPGAVPSELPLPVRAIDFAQVTVLNPPYYTRGETDAALSDKQDTISDLATIRSGAALGATAVQPSAIGDMETKTHAAATYQPKGSYLTSESDPTVDGKIATATSGLESAAHAEQAYQPKGDYLTEGDLSHISPRFSNEVLAVSLSLDTNSVAVLNELAATVGDFPIAGTATSVGGLLLALAAAVTWLRRNKLDKSSVLDPWSDGVKDGDAADAPSVKNEFEQVVYQQQVMPPSPDADMNDVAGAQATGEALAAETTRAQAAEATKRDKTDLSFLNPGDAFPFAIEKWVHDDGGSVFEFLPEQKGSGWTWTIVGDTWPYITGAKTADGWRFDFYGDFDEQQGPIVTETWTGSDITQASFEGGATHPVVIFDHLSLQQDFSASSPASYLLQFIQSSPALATRINGLIASALPYPVNTAGTILDRNINVITSAAATVPSGFHDLLIRATVASSLAVTMPTGFTVYGDAFPGETGEYLVTITKIKSNEAFVRTIKLEVPNA